MSLNILSVAYPLAPVGQNAVGGAEQILAILDESIVTRGHHSMVIACNGSCVKGELYSIPSFHAYDEDAIESARSHVRRKLQAILESTPIDLVHMHGIDFTHYLPDIPVSVLVTLHLPLSWYKNNFQTDRPQTYFNCVSHHQRSTCMNARDLPVVENGVYLPVNTSRSRRRRYALALGRICPEKGFEIALDAARMAQTEVFLAGSVFPYREHLDYFDFQIKPRLNSQCHFIGPIGSKKKIRLMSEARCLLIPSLVPETSSLVAMEAMACGTPVIAFPSGCLSNIVIEGKTGFLVTNAREMSEAILNVESIDPDACRKHAFENYSAKRMCEDYFDLYEDIVRQKTALKIKCEV